jgi:Cu-Zn family superoxide dismutase
MRHGRRNVYLGVGAVVVLALAIAAPLYAFGNGKPDKPVKHAEADLIDLHGNTVGHVELRFDKKNGLVEVDGEASGLPPGFHGFHVHSIGICDPSVGFATAGGHLNPAGATHPNHAGDMPVLLVNSDGSAAAKFDDDRFTADDLFDADGSAFIVHMGPDNYANVTRYGTPDATTLNTGDAGARIACGVVEAH